MTTSPTFLDRVRAIVPESRREEFYRIVAGVTTGLLAFGLLSSEEAALWAQLGVSTVTLLFALLYSTSGWRTALYAITGPLGAVLMAYSIVDDVRWALITAAVAQLFGLSTAAAKTVQRDYDLAA